MNIKFKLCVLRLLMLKISRMSVVMISLNWYKGNGCDCGVCVWWIVLVVIS